MGVDSSQRLKAAQFLGINCRERREMAADAAELRKLPHTSGAAPALASVTILTYKRVGILHP